MKEIIGKKLILREIENYDLSQLCKWRNSNDFLYLCTNKRNIVTLEEFGYEINEDFNRDRFLQVIVLTKSADYVGTLYAYRYNKVDGTIYVTIYIDYDYRSYNYGVEALTLFVKYLFEYFGIFKIYVEVYSYNKKVIRMLKMSGFKVEGCLKKHRNLEDERCDMYILAFYREDFDTKAIKRIIRRFDI